MSTGHDDYTRQPYDSTGTSAGAAEWNPADYDFIPLEATPDADAIEQEAEARDAEFRAKYPRYRDIDPGDHELVVTGFVKPPENKLKTGWLRDQQVSWESASVGVRFASVFDRLATVTDWFELPPRDPRQQEAYLYATKERGGTNPGFGSKKFGHFISRLGFPFAPGAQLPREACTLGNWIGRHIHATAEKERLKKGEQPRMNQQTGMPFPLKTQIRMFSYRPAASNGGVTVPAASVAHARPAAQPTRQPAPAASSFASNGLDDI